MAALQYVDVPGYASLILRRTFKQLDLPGAIMSRAHEWLRPTDAHWNDDRKTYTFPTGATLTFGYLENANDVYRYQGPEFQFVGFDELTQFEESQYRYLFSRVRRLVGSSVPIRVRAASNPGGVGHAWVKRRFIDERKPTVVFIPAKLDDNPHLDRDEYVQSLSELDDTLRAQLLDGDWGAFEGAAFTIVDPIHIVPAFDPPNEWERFESMDFGAANPTAWGAWAVDYDGNLVCFDLYYRPGLVTDHAHEILARRAAGWEARGADGWVERNRCWADPSIRNKVGLSDRMGNALSIEAEFQDHGIRLVPANNDPRAGYMRIAELLRPDKGRPFPDWHPRYGDYGAPRMFITSTCRELSEQLKTAPIRPLDQQHGGQMVDPKWESAHGHAVAMCRYGVMSRPGASPVPVKTAETAEELRVAHAKAMLERLERGPEHVYV